MTGVTENDIAIAALMRNLSLEAGRLAKVAERLDDMLGDFAAENGQVAQSLLVELQDADVLRQALVALQQITSSAAAEIPSKATFNLSKHALAVGVTLESVREACLCDSESCTQFAEQAKANEKNKSIEDPVFFDSQ